MPLYFSVLLLTIAVVCRSDDVIDEATMRAAVDSLSGSYSSLKTNLGIDMLAEEYSKAHITYSSINITKLLNNVPAQAIVNKALNLLQNLSSASVQSVTPPIEGIEECNCSSNASSNISICCHGCDDVTADNIQTAAMFILSSNIDKNVEINMGFPNGSILTSSAYQYKSCTSEDSRLKSWYNTLMRSIGREIVVFLDINGNGIPGGSSSRLLRDTAVSVIRSFGVNDKVGLVMVTDNNRRTCPDVLRSATVEVKDDMIRVIEDLLASQNRVYTTAFKEAIGFFTDNVNDKLLLLITDGRGRGPGDTNLATFMSEVDSLFTNDFKFLIYTANDVPANNSFINYLATLDSDSIRPLSNIGTYISVFSTSGGINDDLFITTDINRNNELSLSVSRTWLDNNTSEPVAVVNFMLPWRYLLGSELESAISRRPFSYHFVLNRAGSLFYHGRFSSRNVVDLELSVFETESASILSNITGSTSSNEPRASDIQHVVHHSGDLGFINRIVPSNYKCDKILSFEYIAEDNELDIYACVVVATEDQPGAPLFNIDNIREVYQDENRVPIYSEQLASLSPSDSCTSHCLQSIENRYSLQLTMPLTPPTSMVSEIASYISTGRSKPPGIEGNIAEEVSTQSVVGPQWLRHSVLTDSIPIKRRHLATPTGIYLGHPAVNLNSTFVPQYLPWYISAATNREEKFYLSAPQTDQLDGVGVVYTASYPLLDDNGVLLSVVAADISIESLEQHITDNIGTCGSPSISCFIANNRGEYVTHTDQSLSDDYIIDTEEYIDIVRMLNTQDILRKQGCSSLPSGHNIYYTMSLNDSVTNCFNPDNGCFDFCIRAIPGTDSFLFVLRRNKADCSTNTIRPCSMTCFECDQINSLSIECPCMCHHDTCTEINRIPYPTCPAQTTPPSNYNAVSVAMASTQCNEDRCCSYDMSDCTSSFMCNWCHEQEICLPSGSCCSDDISCCNTSYTRSCLIPYCFERIGNKVCPTPSPSLIPPSSTTSGSTIDRQAAIIGGVIGGVFGVALLGLLIVCCVWYQVFSKPESSHKSDFNFADINNVSTVNKTAIELKGMEPLATGEKKPENEYMEVKRAEPSESVVRSAVV